MIPPYLTRAYWCPFLQAVLVTRGYLATMESGKLVKALRKHFGHDTFRPLQQEAISHILKPGDAFVLFPTGAGKSLCFMLPGR